MTIDYRKKAIMSSEMEAIPAARTPLDGMPASQPM
jgi:hypothetical protein